MADYIPQNPVFRWAGDMASFARTLFEDVFKTRKKLNEILDESPRLYVQLALQDPPDTMAVYLGGETGNECTRARRWRFMEASVHDDGLGATGDECQLTLYNVTQSKTVFETTLVATTSSAAWYYASTTTVVATSADYFSAGDRYHVIVSVSDAGPDPFEYLTINLAYTEYPALLRD